MSLRTVSFICGCGHSGTTLLANMFAAHPEVYVPLRETNIFLKPADKAAAAYAELVAEAEADGKLFLVEKTPRHIRAMDKIREIVDAPRFIVPVRDGRDVTASIARRRNNSDVSPGITRWIVDNRIVLAERDSDDVYVYRHEDLVADPEAVLRQICDFAGIPFDAEMLNYHRTERNWFGIGAGDAADRPEHAKRRNRQINQPIFDSSGRWRTELEEESLRPLIKGRGKVLMEEFGYL